MRTKKGLIDVKQRRSIVFFAVVCLCVGLALFSWNCKGINTQENGTEPTGLTDYQLNLITELNDLIHAISAFPIDLDDNQLSALDFLKYARIVGLGEATHGTKEFFQMKHRIFKYLVENHGFKAFGFECDFGESLFIDRYITTGQGDLHDLMRNTMHFWTWKTYEVRDLLRWMMEYNQGKPREQMIRYLGFDCQFMTYQGEWLIQFLETADQAYLGTVRTFLEDTGSLDYNTYETMTQEEWNQIQEGMQNIFDHVTASEAQYAAITGQEEYEIAEQLARSMIQSHKVMYNYHHADGSGINYRDMYMAENAKWIADFMGPGAKIAAWAHNGHVASNAGYGGGQSMGKYLKDDLGDAYQIIGFSFCQGAFNAVFQDSSGNYTGLQKCETLSDPRSYSVNEIFHYAEYGQFIFVLADMGQDSELRNWLSSPKYFLNIGAAWNGNANSYYRSETITTFYDALIHFDTTTEARRL
jgi:erythromycin esterase